LYTIISLLIVVTSSTFTLSLIFSLVLMFLGFVLRLIIKKL
jgi:hypothetical protein